MSRTKTKPSGSRTVLWWVVWIVLTIASFFAAAAIWTPFIAKHFGTIRETRASILWVVAVFGSWLVMLVPLIIVMYQKVDKVYEDARLRREKASRQFRSIYVDPARRKLSAAMISKLKGISPIMNGGHLVNVTLKDGRRIKNVFVAGGREILGVYDVHEFSFEGSDVEEMELADLKAAPITFAQNWLRLDGVKPLD